MIISIIKDLLINAFFILCVVFFAVVLPVYWAAVLSVPVLGIFFLYRKLGRVEASMNESVREYQVYSQDHKAALLIAQLVIIAAGVIVVFNFAGEVHLLPVNETRKAFENVDKLNDIEEGLRSLEAEIKLLRDQEQKSMAGLADTQKATTAAIEKAARQDEAYGKKNLEASRERLEAVRDVVNAIDKLKLTLEEIKDNLSQEGGDKE